MGVQLFLGSAEINIFVTGRTVPHVLKVCWGQLVPIGAALERHGAVEERRLLPLGAVEARRYGVAAHGGGFFPLLHRLSLGCEMRCKPAYAIQPPY